MNKETIIDRQQLLKAIRLHASGNHKEADLLFRQILGADPRQPDSLHILGGLAMSIGHEDTAMSLLNQAIQLNPMRSHYYVTLARVYKRQAQLENAIRCYRKALELNPEDTDILVSLGNVHHLNGSSDEAAFCYRKVLEAEPDVGSALLGLAAVYKDQGLATDARTLYERYVNLKADAGVEIKKALLLPVICESTETIRHARLQLGRSIEQLRQRKIRLDNPYRQVGTTGFHLAYHGLGDKDLLQGIGDLYLSACSDISWVNPACYDDRKESGKIVIGVVSRFLHQHTIGYLNCGIIENLNRDRFTVKVFRFKGKIDRLAKRINRAADEVIYLPDHLENARRIIAAHPLDVLFYPDIGMDSLTYFLAFARLAPVQCTTWGHADTSGIPNLDYYLSYAEAEPQGAPRHYSEKLVLLNRFPMFCDAPDIPEHKPGREKFGLPANCHLYMCCQSLFKVHPDFDAVIKDILERDPDGVFVLFEGKYPSWGKLLRARFARELPEVADRIHFHPRLAREDFLSMIRLADVMLDTLHFCGGYTTLLCLAAGVPIVTLPGEFMRSRMTLAFYRQMGLLDCIADDRRAYIDLALRLANDTHFNRRIRSSIKERGSALFKDVEAIHALERFFQWSVAQARP